MGGWVGMWGGGWVRETVPNSSCFLVNSNRTIRVFVVVYCCQLIAHSVSRVPELLNTFGVKYSENYLNTKVGNENFVAVSK